MKVLVVADMVCPTCRTDPRPHTLREAVGLLTCPGCGRVSPGQQWLVIRTVTKTD